MMTIRNIGEWDFYRKQTRNGLHRALVVYYPHSMRDAIGGAKIIQREVVPFPALDQVVDYTHATISQKYIAGLRTCRRHMVDAVRLFVGTCQLMHFDDPMFIVVYRAATYKTRLFPPVHDQPVDVVTGLVFFYQPALVDKIAEVLHRLVINFLAVRVYV